MRTLQVFSAATGLEVPPTGYSCPCEAGPCRLQSTMQSACTGRRGPRVAAPARSISGPSYLRRRSHRSAAARAAQVVADSATTGEVKRKVTLDMASVGGSGAAQGAATAVNSARGSIMPRLTAHGTARHEYWRTTRLHVASRRAHARARGSRQPKRLVYKTKLASQLFTPVCRTQPGKRAAPPHSTDHKTSWGISASAGARPRASPRARQAPKLDPCTRFSNPAGGHLSPAAPCAPCRWPPGLAQDQDHLHDWPCERGP